MRYEQPPHASAVPFGLYGRCDASGALPATGRLIALPSADFVVQYVAERRWFSGFEQGPVVPVGDSRWEFAESRTGPAERTMLTLETLPVAPTQTLTMALKVCPMRSSPTGSRTRDASEAGLVNN